MTTADKEREFVKSIYPSDKWSKKVDKMADDQVLAVYFRLRYSMPDTTPNQEPSNLNTQLRLFP